MFTRNRSAVVAAFVFISAGCVLAAEAPKEKPASPEFERMKALAGKWNGKMDMGQGSMEVTVEYRLVAGGSAIEERLFAGTPKEMVTMYYDQQGKLALTHYCVFGNRPRMSLKSSDAKAISFDFDKAADLDPNAEPHMHALTITFEKPDTITHDWLLYKDGQPAGNHKFTFTREK